MTLIPALATNLTPGTRASIQQPASEHTDIATVFLTCASSPQTEKFIRAFYTTMQREWSGIDRLRLDKFYNLIRCFQRETFVYLAKSHWRVERIMMANKIVSEGPLGLGRGGGVTPASKTPGLQLHMVDILLEEITEALHEGITVDGWMLLLEPYTQLLGSSVDRTVFERVVSRIFQELAGPKWLRAGLAEQGDDDDEIKTKKLRHANRMFRHTYVEPLPEHSISEHFQDTAFAAEVAHAMTSKIFAMTISPDTWEFGRRKLYDLLAEYKQLCADLGQPFEDDPDAVELPKKRKKNAFLKKQRRDKRAKAAEEALEGDGDGFGAAGGESASADDADEAGGDSDDAQGHSRSREGAGDDEAEEEAAPVTARPVKAGKSASKARMVSAKEASPRKTRSGKTR